MPIFVKQDIRWAIGIHVELFELLLRSEVHHIVCDLARRLHRLEGRHIFVQMVYLSFTQQWLVIDADVPLELENFIAGLEHE